MALPDDNVPDNNGPEENGALQTAPLLQSQNSM
jgi:hypothetical protein